MQTQVFAVYLGYTKISADLATYRDAVNWARDFMLSGDVRAPLSIRKVEPTMGYVGTVDFDGTFTVKGE